MRTIRTPPPLTSSSQVVQDVVQVFADDEDSLVGGLEGLFGELSHVGLQEGVEDVGEGFPSLLLQILLCCQTPLWLSLHHLSHLRQERSPSVPTRSYLNLMNPSVPAMSY